MKRTLRGFTLIELLVVISIIATLAAMMMPVFSRAREKARQVVCSSNQRQLAAAITMYTQDHDEMMPNSDSVWGVISSSVQDPKIIQCPTLGTNVANAYVFNSYVCGLSLGNRAFWDPTQTMFTCDGAHTATNAPEVTYGNILYTADDIDQRHTDHAICSFADGHVALDNTIQGFEYRNSFSAPVGKEWSVTTISTTPVGNHPFLGEFNNNTVKLTLANLPPHLKITVNLDLYIIQDWHGNGPPADIWSVIDENGPIFSTTFAQDPNSTQYTQSYPLGYPSTTLNAMRTGATAQNNLGYTFNGVPMDSTYHIVLPCNHTDSTLTLQFQGAVSQPIASQGWGIRDIEVSAQ